MAAESVHPGGTLITRVGADVRWWTWAGYRANATLTANLPGLADPVQRPSDAWVRLRQDLTPEMWRKAAAGTGRDLVLPSVDPRAVKGLKFSAALPSTLGTAVVAERLADLDGADIIMRQPVRFHIR